MKAYEGVETTAATESLARARVGERQAFTELVDVVRVVIYSP